MNVLKFPTPILQGKVWHRVQMSGEGHRFAFGGKICGHSEQGRPPQRGTRGGYYEYIAAPPHHPVVRCIRIPENDVCGPRTVSIPIKQFLLIRANITILDYYAKPTLSPFSIIKNSKWQNFPNI